MEYSKPDATLHSRLTFLIKSLFQVFFNIIVIYLIFFSGNRVFFGYPLFAEGLIQAGASQFNRWIMLSRKKAADAATSQDLTKRKAECIASVVGYREDADVFKKCLESYASNYDQRHAAICVGIDGNEAEDYKMCIVAEEVSGCLPHCLFITHIKAGVWTPPRHDLPRGIVWSHFSHHAGSCHD